MGGRRFQMDEDAYQKLSHYLEALKAHFSKDGEAGKEIVDDIEQRIAELMEERIANGKQVITLGDVHEVIRILGKVEDFVYDEKTETSHTRYGQGEQKTSRRLFRDPEHYYLGGVASGLGEYLDVDPLWIRIAFVALAFLKLFGVLVYVILWIVVPKARTTSEKLQMRGRPVNLSTIKDSINEEYYRNKSGEGSETYQNTTRSRNAFESFFSAIATVIFAFFKFLLAGIGVLFLIIGSIILACLVMVLLGFSNVFGHMMWWNGYHVPELSHFFANSGYYYAAVVAMILLVVIPVIALIYGGIKILFNIQSHHRILRAFLLTSWILALILFISIIMVNTPNHSVEASGTNSYEIEKSSGPRLRIEAVDNTGHMNLTHYHVFDHTFNYSNWNDALYDRITLYVEPSEDNEMHLIVNKKIMNVGLKNSKEYLDQLAYSWEKKDSVLYLDEFFQTEADDFWMFSEVDVKLRIPEGQVVAFAPGTCSILNLNGKWDGDCYDLQDKSIVVTPEGMRLQQGEKTTEKGHK